MCWCGVPRSLLRCRAISPAASRRSQVSRSSTTLQVTALEGGDHLESVTICNADTGQSRKIATRALFIMVGALPNTEWLSGLVQLDDKGFVVTGLGLPASPFTTSLPGIFAVGDVRAGSVKRVASGRRRRLGRDLEGLREHAKLEQRDEKAIAASPRH